MVKSAAVPTSAVRVAALTSAALLGFAANSLLCRAALLGEGARIDAATFTAVRLVSGALMLAVLFRLRRHRQQASATSGPRRGARLRGDHEPRPTGSELTTTAMGRRGSWGSALALFVYAAGFSLAYVRIGAGSGALVLFGFVQLTMLGSGVLRGERPRRQEWMGLVIAFAGLVLLTAPGASAPDLLGAGLMAAAGIAWGVYSLRGRGGTDPLGITTDNFLRCVPLALMLVVFSSLLGVTPGGTPLGYGLAIASGALASGVGYSLWYAALPHLTATRAGILQLAVPVLAATGGVLFLEERVTPRVLAAGATLLFGVLLALVSRRAG